MKLLHTIRMLGIAFLINQSGASAQQNETEQNTIATATLGVSSCVFVMAAGGFETAKHYFRQNNYPRSEKLCGYASHACLGTGIILFLGWYLREGLFPINRKQINYDAIFDRLERFV